MKTLSLFFLCSILVTLTGGCERRASDSTAVAVTPHNPTASVSTPAQSLELPRIDLAGIRQLIEQARSDKQVLVIDFWATWCVPCVNLFGPLHQAMHQHGSEVRLVSVTLDSPGTYEQKAIAFLERHQAQRDAFLLKPDSDAQLEVVQALGKQWRQLEVPAILIYGLDGQLAGEFLGGELEPIVRAVEQLLAGKAGVSGHEHE